MYSVPVVGVAAKGYGKLYKLATRHLRALAKQPAHVSHCTNQQIWEQLGLKPPAALATQVLKTFLQGLQHSRSLQEDVTNTASNETYIKNVLASFGQLPVHPPTHSAVSDQQGAKAVCPECGQECISENAMRIHCKLVHKYTPAHSSRTPTTFVPHIHAKLGLPQCSLCDRKFFRWGNLKEHIRTGSCVKLGGDSLVRHPKENESHLTSGTPPPAEADKAPDFLQEGPKDETVNPDHALPLVLRPSFHALFPNWERFLRTPGSRQLLSSRCVICNMWIADAKHIKQHYNNSASPRSS